MADTTWDLSGRGTNPATVLDTGLNSLASGSGALSAAISNDGSGEFDLFADAELVVTYGTNPTDGNPVELWLVRQVDGTNYEDAAGGATPVYPRNGLVGIFSLQASTSGQRIVIPQIVIPPGDFKLLLVNKAGQTMAASGNTLKLLFYRFATV